MKDFDSSIFVVQAGKVLVLGKWIRRWSDRRRRRRRRNIIPTSTKGEGEYKTNSHKGSTQRRSINTSTLPDNLFHSFALSPSPSIPLRSPPITRRIRPTLHHLLIPFSRTNRPSKRNEQSHRRRSPIFDCYQRIRYIPVPFIRSLMPPRPPQRYMTVRVTQHAATPTACDVSGFGMRW